VNNKFALYGTTDLSRELGRHCSGAEEATKSTPVDGFPSSSFSFYS
jgi:hypothetical protein